MPVISRAASWRSALQRRAQLAMLADVRAAPPLQRSAGDTEQAQSIAKRNLSLKVKGPCCAGTLFGGRLGRIANCSLEGRVRSSLACRSRQRLARKRSCGVPQLPRSAPALVTAVSEARTAATVLRGGQGGSRRCLPAPTPPLPPLASKASASSRTDLTARSLRERANVLSIVLTRSNFRKHAGARLAVAIGVGGASVVVNQWRVCVPQEGWV